MSDPFSGGNVDWSLTTWAGSRKEQLRRWSELSLDEILQAQEEMAELAADLAAVPWREPVAPALREEAPAPRPPSGG